LFGYAICWIRKEGKIMSEVYIRSQNKEKLYRLGGNYACVEYVENEGLRRKRGGTAEKEKHHTICISDGCLEEIGEYASKERCIEIMDDIQKVCTSYLKLEGGVTLLGDEIHIRPTAFTVPRFYQMPEN